MNTKTKGSIGTQGATNDSGVLFWNRRISSIVQAISDKLIRDTTTMAHHDLARDEACQPQMINVLGPVKPMQLVTMAASANEVVLCEGCRT